MGHERRQRVVELGAVDNAQIDPVLLAVDGKVVVRFYDRSVDHSTTHVAADLDDFMSSQISSPCSSPAELNRPSPLSQTSSCH
jgi:hypothetical protein